MSHDSGHATVVPAHAGTMSQHMQTEVLPRFLSFPLSKYLYKCTEVGLSCNGAYSKLVLLLSLQTLVYSPLCSKMEGFRS
jgi:hypothetical protein